MPRRFADLTHEVFARHSNPWSAWTRWLSTPLVLVPLWTRRWSHAASSGRPWASSNRRGCGSWPNSGEPRSMPLTLLSRVVSKSWTQPSQSRLTPSHTSTSNNPGWSGCKARSNTWPC